MIEKIGIVFQGPNDQGFLEGLKRRIGCNADFVVNRIRGKHRVSVRRDSKKNWDYFRKEGVHLVVRLTDTEGKKWQDIKREEFDHFPEEMRSILICGVNHFAIESWLAIDRRFLEDELGIPVSESFPPEALVGRVKTAIARHNFSNSSKEVVTYLVENAPANVFQRWLEEPSFKEFYQDCRRAAKQEDCPINDELAQASE